MDIREMKDEAIWDAFVLEHAPRSGAFLHAFGWGGQDAQRVGWFQDGVLHGVAALERVALPLGMHYLLCQRGPIFSSREEWTQVAEFLRSAAEKSSAMFVRFEPTIEAFQPRETSAKHVRPVNPEHTLVLPLQQSEDDLLAAMHPKTRYNIHLSERKGVQVRFHTASDRTQGEAGRFDEVWPLFETTAKRDRFRLHVRSHYAALLATKSSGTFRTFLAVASVMKRIAAAAIMVDFGATRTYLHGASSYDLREYMAPHLLHWRLIQDAKAHGLAQYDWWGMAGSDSPRDPWAGITRFKKGFGGEVVSYPGTFDLVFDPLRYRLYTGVRSIAQSIRRQTL